MGIDYTKRFSLPTKDEQNLLTGVVILDKLITNKRSFSPSFTADDTHIEGVISYLVNKKLLLLDESQAYQISPLGKQVYEIFLERYLEYILIFNFFKAVDTGSLEFAMSKKAELDESEFNTYLEEDRFLDLRVAIAEFKKINPIELLFMDYIHQNKQEIEQSGEGSWQFQLVYGDVFNNITNKCNKSLHYEELGYEDELGKVSGKDVLCDIYEEGIKQTKTNLLENLIANEQRLLVIKAKVDAVLGNFDSYLANYKKPEYALVPFSKAIIDLNL